MIPTPKRPLVVMDPSKLTYFARAQAVRAGATGAYGALSGLGYTVPDYARVSVDNMTGESTGSGVVTPEVTTEPGAYSGPGSRDGWVSDTAVPNAYTTAPGEPSMLSIDKWMEQLNKLIAGNGGAQRQSLAAPSPWPMVIGGAALLVGAVVLVKVLKKR